VRVVLDTNVVMSGVFFGGIPGAILTHWSDGRFELVLSTEILQEYEQVARDLAGKYAISDDAWQEALRQIALNAAMVDVEPLREPVCADPNDDKFLACARSAAVSLIVSGDRQLREVTGWNGIEVLTPRQFHHRHLRAG
jgi:uncharacterized protein